MNGANRMPVGSGYFVQCFLWGVLAGIGLIILGTVLVASGGVGVFGGVALIAIGFVLPVLGGWASGVFLEATTRRLSGRAFRIKVWSIPVRAITEISAEPTNNGTGTRANVMMATTLHSMKLVAGDVGVAALPPGIEFGSDLDKAYRGNGTISVCAAVEAPLLQ